MYEYESTFDRVNYGLLFTKLIYKNRYLYLLLDCYCFWNTKQKMKVRCGIIRYRLHFKLVIV